MFVESYLDNYVSILNIVGSFLDTNKDFGNFWSDTFSRDSSRQSLLFVKNDLNKIGTVRNVLVIIYCFF